MIEIAFTGIKKGKKKAAYVAEQIVDTIRRGEYKVGDRLPPERAIAEQMKVSRNSVREALSALHILGIIESKPGDGTYVCSSIRRNVHITNLGIRSGLSST